MSTELEDRFRAVVRDFTPALWRLGRGYEHDEEKRRGLVNLHPRSGFEQGCEGWGSYRGTLASSDIARSGLRSCRVCTSNTTDIFTADDQGVSPNPPIGSEWLAEAWVRSDPGRAIPPNVGITLRSKNDTPSFAILEQDYDGLNGPPTATWQKVAVTLTITKAAQTINIVVGADAVDGGCFVLDDVALYKTK